MPLLESDPQDILLDADGDIVLDEEGLHFVSGLQAVAQACRIRILMFRGEWFQNMDVGVPYFEGILDDKFDQAAARAALTAAILDAPGVIGIKSLTVDLDASSRTLSITFVAQTLFGDTPPDLLEVK